MLKKSVRGIWLIFPKEDIIGKYLTGCTMNRYATNTHPKRFSNVPLLPLRNFNRLGVIMGHVPFLPRACPGITTKHGGKTAHVSLQLFPKLIAID